MNSQVLKSSLSQAQRNLVELCQEHPFCRIEGLRVRLGEPLFEPPPKITQKLKMGGDNTRRPESTLPDFWLKKPMIDLLETIAELGDGQIDRIDVANGLPILVEIVRHTALGGGHSE